MESWVVSGWGFQLLAPLGVRLESLDSPTLVKKLTMHSALIHILVTGDYLGYAATGFEEDSPMVTTLLALHALLF